ncbi:hypothetical protein OH491_01735 [Termitidicoccus mucosus]|uniref:Uncharacterized protein n=1 Tax=Termitidicoccus mucosus TaxID=1184151 RepID=A0A178ILC7_9BACT|nr:hypothetical protein AW736_07820 [Opitutaceae bacterium TSB47]
MKSLTLEVSLKPFFNLDAAATLAVCREALCQYRALIGRADALSIMFWSADGSEILDYAGDLDAPMEWARFLGNANPHMPVPADPGRKSLHARNYLYREDAQPITYRRFADIARAWREAAAEIGREISVGATFDPGGEFAPSSFKYQRHREICLSNTMGKASFVACYATLHADQRRYAGYPDGIPEGTALGSFLGRQFRHFARDLGFDFLWLSNGFGFGLETWKTIGPLFDGEAFHPEGARELGGRIMDFWRDFRRECPDLPVRTRGTNLGTGTDLASDATPLRELYAGGFNFAPPPNSPWASINGDFGIELAGYQSRVVELPPGAGFPFRFYLHDPWWLNSPWIDRYEGQPHDIYLPLAVGRVSAEGRVSAAEHLSLITIDDSHGRMPERVPNESIPHLLRAWDERPDAAGPIVWLYPFDELHDSQLGPAPEPARLFHTDWFAREALNDGVPLNTVMSTRTFDALGARVGAVLAGRILVTPAPLAAGGEERLLAWADGGGSLIIYGPLEHAPGLRKRLGLMLAASLSDEFTVQTAQMEMDDCRSPRPATYTHRMVMSGGGLAEAPVNPAACLATATRGADVRALVAECITPAGGRLSWLRGPLPLSVSSEEHLPQPAALESTFPLSALLRQVLAGHGWRASFETEGRVQRHPVMALHRHANGWFFSGYMPDTTVGLTLHTPFGAPLLLGAETCLRDGVAHYRMPRAWRHECRVFVGQTSGVASATESCPAQVGVTRRLWIRGLKDAVVRFFPMAGSGPVTLWLNPEWPHIGGQSVPLREVATPHGPMLETTVRIDGTALLSW